MDDLAPRTRTTAPPAPTGTSPGPRRPHARVARGRPRTPGLLGAAALLLLSVAAAPAAAGSARGEPVVVAEDLVGPLSLEVSRRGDVVVAQSFAGLLTTVDRTGRRTDLPLHPGEEAAGLSTTGAGVLLTHSAGEGPDAVALLERRDRRGRVDVVADLAAHERATNVDGGTTYGLRDTSRSCLDQLPDGFPGRYTGEVYSHPYATAPLGGGRTVVADAGGNALLAVDARGRVRTLAVLPAQPAVLTADLVAENGLPACTVGQTYWFEPVPTDVEVGPGSDLYVSLLPGGPEDPSLGARGSVVRVDPRTGAVRTVLDGLLGATGVAVGDDGTVYAAELFGGRVVALDAGAHERRTVLEADLPAAVEVSGGRLYVTTQVLGPQGQVVRVDL
ncbi:ScyD/ScyE family protein [Pseudokineococcus basanitobsidens]|uniref:ScyD/ScyE family protein n=1 Tax=Pseudokineococcus basanitobsidens TaxID=1926649 RepID=A0ABU8RFG4_9ACTN